MIWEGRLQPWAGRNSSARQGNEGRIPNTHWLSPGRRKGDCHLEAVRRPWDALATPRRGLTPAAVAGVADIRPAGGAPVGAGKAVPSAVLPAPQSYVNRVGSVGSGEHIRRRWLFFKLREALSNGRNGATSQWDSLWEQLWLPGRFCGRNHNGHPWRAQDPLSKYFKACLSHS